VTGVVRARRFVNGVVDEDQRAEYAQNIYRLARRKNLPHSLVTLRHDATHGVLPSLVVLRNAAHVVGSAVVIVA
jgi:ribosomal biogenesis protein LAS1